MRCVEPNGFSLKFDDGSQSRDYLKKRLKSLQEKTKPRPKRENPHFSTQFKELKWGEITSEFVMDVWRCGRAGRPDNKQTHNSL